MIRIIQKVGNVWIFLAGAIGLYVVVGIINPAIFLEAIAAFLRIFIGVIPIILLVFGLMFVTNLALKAKQIVGYLGTGSGLKGWVVAIGGGILSHGPIYMWYPLLSDLKEKGMRDSLIAAFLYNRAVKIPLLPVMIFYFGLGFVVILSVLMVLFSIVNGVLVERIQGR